MKSYVNGAHEVPADLLAKFELDDLACDGQGTEPLSEHDQRRASRHIRQAARELRKRREAQERKTKELIIPEEPELSPDA